jgi:hypothetical protein
MLVGGRACILVVSILVSITTVINIVECNVTQLA